MRITNARDLGLYVRDRRRHDGLTQTDLALAANVSRRWLADLEAGKPTVEIGLVFQTLAALGLMFDARPARMPGEIDLDEHLRRIGQPSKASPPVSEAVESSAGDEGNQP